MNRTKTVLLALAAAVAMTPIAATSASATTPPAPGKVVTSVTTKTLATSAQVSAAVKAMSAAAPTPSADCDLTPALSAILKASRAGKATTAPTAKRALGERVTTREAACKANAVVAQQIATVWQAWNARHRVVVKETVVRDKSGVTPKVTTTRTIGVDLRHARTSSFTL